MEKLKKVVYKAILIILLVLVLYVTYSSIFNIYQAKENLKPLVLIIGTIVTICVFARLKKISRKIPENRANLIAIILSIVFFVGLSIFGNALASIPAFDLSNIIKEAEIMVRNGGKFVTEGYFSVYSNQVPLTVLVYYIFKVGNILNVSNLKAFAIVVNALFISITAFFTYLSVKKLKDYKSGLITLIFFVINPIFYLTASYFYADTLCMPFAAISIYIFISASSEANGKKKILLEAIAGILLAIGFKIRVVLGILLIALLMVKIFTKQNKKIISILTIIISFAIGYGMCHLVEEKCEPLINEDLKYPATHWLMLGANYKTDGRYNSEDFWYTKNMGTYSEKTQTTIAETKQRISEIGPAGIIPFMGTKLTVNWSNGSYDYLIKLINVEKINNLYEYVVGNRKIFITYFYQICKITILSLFLLAIVNEIKSKEGINSKYNFIYVAIFGAFIFYLMWEVLTRYSLTFLPWMMLVFAIGIEEFENILDKASRKFDTKANIVKRFICIAIIVCSIIFLGANYNEYAVKKSTFSDKRVMQYSSEQGDMVPKIANNNVQQTFKTDKSFNSISIRIKKENIKELTHYNCVLKESNGKELVKAEFTSEQVENNKLKTFEFERIRPEGEQEYIIEIYSTDATQDNSIGISTFYQEGYDSYPGGKLIINGEEKNADFTFQVQNKIKRTYVSKKVYILLGFIIILIEIFAFYPYLKYNKEEIYEMEEK